MIVILVGVINNNSRVQVGEQAEEEEEGMIKIMNKVVIVDVVVVATQAVAAEAVKAVRAVTLERPTRTRQSRRKIRSTERCEKPASE